MILSYTYFETYYFGEHGNPKSFDKTKNSYRNGTTFLLNKPGNCTVAIQLGR
jgi:hypothetical protein